MIEYHEIREQLDIRGVLGNEAAVSGSRHRWKQRGEACVTTEDLDDQESLV